MQKAKDRQRCLAADHSRITSLLVEAAANAVTAARPTYGCSGKWMSPSARLHEPHVTWESQTDSVQPSLLQLSGLLLLMLLLLPGNTGHYWLVVLGSYGRRLQSRAAWATPQIDTTQLIQLEMQL